MRNAADPINPKISSPDTDIMGNLPIDIGNIIENNLYRLPDLSAVSIDLISKIERNFKNVVIVTILMALAFTAVSYS